MTDHFDWRFVLSKPGFKAAKISLIKHAPGKEIWDFVSAGIKLIIRHSDVPQVRKTRGRKKTASSRSAYWVATVIRVEGYYCLVRYIGMKDSSRDIWIHLGTCVVHPVGGELPGVVLIPPSCVYGKIREWRTYLIKSLEGEETLPFSFLDFFRSSVNACKYKLGGFVEVIDKYKISQLRVARVNKVTGGRLYLCYLDDRNDGFYCHEDSALIHPLGWAGCIGHKLAVPNDVKLPIALQRANATSVDSVLNTEYEYEGSTFRVGMKLEAVDPLCPSRICAATICNLLNYGYMMLKMDCYDDLSPLNLNSALNEESNQWFCYHVNSPYIFKCGFCELNGIALAPPAGHEPAAFTWEEYLDKSQLAIAPIPEQPKLHHGFEILMKLEMADVMTPSKIYAATVTQVVGRLLRVNFDGWDPEFDQWIDAESPDIYPVGWCELVGHKLESVLCPSPCKSKRKKISKW